MKQQEIIAEKFNLFLKSFDNLDPDEVAIFISNYLYENGIQPHPNKYITKYPLLDKE
jgi:hypothetical protein